MSLVNASPSGKKVSSINWTLSCSTVNLNKVLSGKSLAVSSSQAFFKSPKSRSRLSFLPSFPLLRFSSVLKCRCVEMPKCLNTA